jgi:hypothetical protein
MLVASGVNDGHRTAVLAGRAVEVLREIGRLTGELSKISTLNVTNNTAILIGSPMFVRLEEMLLTRLRAYPEALASVVDGLRELEGSDIAQTIDGHQALAISDPRGVEAHAA